MTLGEALHILNREAKAIDQTRNYVNCMLHGRVPGNIPRDTVDIIAMRYTSISLHAVERWDPDMWEDEDGDSIIIQGADYNIPDEVLEHVWDVLTLHRQTYYRLKHEVLSKSKADKRIKNIQSVHGTPMVLVYLDGYLFHDYLSNKEEVNHITRTKYRQPDYSHVMPVSMSDLDDALDTIIDFLSEKEGGNDE